MTSFITRGVDLWAVDSKGKIWNMNWNLSSAYLDYILTMFWQPRSYNSFANIKLNTDIWILTITFGWWKQLPVGYRTQKSKKWKRKDEWSRVEIKVQRPSHIDGWMAIIQRVDIWSMFTCLLVTVPVVTLACNAIANANWQCHGFGPRRLPI